MNELQREHLRRLDAAFARRLHPKYAKGAEEHGGNLFDLTPLQLIDMALDEVVDQWTYLQTLRDKIAAMQVTDEDLRKLAGHLD
jgi:hypothetical protein